MCCPLASTLILDSTTIYGIFLVMQYLSITSFLCNTKHKLIHNFTLPDLSLPSTSRKLLIKGVAWHTSWAPLPVTFCLLLVKHFFKVDRNQATRSLNGSNTWIRLYPIWRTWESANPFKDIWVFTQNLFLACDQLGNCILLSWHLSGHLMCRSLSRHFLPLYIQWSLSFLGVISWACYQASSGWQIIQSSSWLYQTKHQYCFTR